MVEAAGQQAATSALTGLPSLWFLCTFALCTCAAPGVWLLRSPCAIPCLWRCRGFIFCQVFSLELAAQFVGLLLAAYTFVCNIVVRAQFSLLCFLAAESLFSVTAPKFWDYSGCSVVTCLLELHGVAAVAAGELLGIAAIRVC